MNLNEMYSDLILQHNSNKEHKRKLDHFTYEERGHNPSCGDDISLQVDIEDGLIKDAAFTGTGCAISQAATSIMIDLIKGNTVLEAKKKIEAYLSMIKESDINKIDEYDEELEDLLEDAVLLKNINHFPARVKCATLSWHTLNEILKEDDKKTEKEKK